MSVNLKQIKPDKTVNEGTYYFEVNKEIEKASNIYLTFIIRDKEYKYIVK